MKRIVCVLFVLVFMLCTVPTVEAISTEDERRTIINSAELAPMKTHYPKLDNRVEDIFELILTPDMDTYDKVKACYTYCIEDSVYYQHMKWYDELYAIRDYCGYENIYDVWMIYEACFFLEDKHGVCDDFSAAFAVMCRALGLEAYYVWGETNTTAGDFTGHAWVNIKIGDIFYHFDPQVEANIANRNDGVIGYHRFCVTDEEMEGRLRIEDRAVCVERFGGFACQTVEKTVKISDCYADGMTLPDGSVLRFTVTLEGFGDDASIIFYCVDSDGFGRECEDITVEGNTYSWQENRLGLCTIVLKVVDSHGTVYSQAFNYNFYRFQAPTDVLGDVNGDGAVTPLDASLVLQYNAQLLVISEDYMINGDFNYDGKISPLDASLILQYNAGLISYPAEQ